MFNCPAAHPLGVDVIEYRFDTVENSGMHYNDVDAAGQSIAKF
jgi:hypothetical protein